MKKIMLVIGCLLAFGSTAFSQSDRHVNLFVGYSNLQAEGTRNPNNPNQPLNGDFFDRRRGANGVNVAVAGYFSSVFGLKADFSFNRNKDRQSVTNGEDAIENQVYYLMGGPILKFRNSSRIEPFVHGLAGGAHTRFKVESRRTVTSGTTRNTFDTGTTDFAAAVGGGIDIRLNNHFSIRAFQIDYAPIFLRDRSIRVLGNTGALQTFALEGQRQDNVRISVGVVF